MDYETLRQFADSWGLVFLVAIFVGAVAFVFRPGSSSEYEKNKMIPFHDDEVNDV